MSTKTSIKRIALVAAAALTLGGFTAVSSHAAGVSTTLPFYISTADSGVQASSAADTTQSATGVAGAYNYVALTAGSNLASTDVLGINVTGVNGAISIATQPTTSGAVDTLTVTGNTVASNNYRITGSVVKILTPTVGSFTVTVVKNVTNSSTGAVTTTTLQTFAFSVSAASTVGTYSAANSFANLIETSTPNVTAFAAYETPTVSSSSTDATAPKAKGTVGATPTQTHIIAVRLLDTQATPAGLGGKTVTATITGAGLIAGTGVASDTATVTTFLSAPAAQVQSTVASSTTDDKGWAFIAVYSNGVAGVGTIVIKYTDALAVTNTVATKSVTFYGDIASLTATQGHKTLAAGSATGSTTDTDYAVQLVGKDSAGNEVDISGLTITATSSNAAVIATTTGVGSAGTADALARNLTVSAASGAASGATATVTYSYTNAAGTVITAPALSFKVGGTVINKLAATFGAASYNVGDLVTMTLTATDASGNPVADKQYTVFDTATSTTVFASSAQLTSTPFGSKWVTFKSGVATATFYAPYTLGNLNLSATTNATSTDLVTALQGVAIPAVVAIAGAGGDSSLAYDAASAATDAANNAYEEAQNATQAASDALAAVKALAVQVKALIALVNKIKAKLKA